MYGILCTDDIGIIRHSCFVNYRLALYNTFGKDNFIEIKDHTNLDKITTLFIVDTQLHQNHIIFNTPTFRDLLNKYNLNTVIFNFEKIHTPSFYPGSLVVQQHVKEIKTHTQFMIDVNEMIHYDKNLLVNTEDIDDLKLKMEYNEIVDRYCNICFNIEDLETLFI